MRKAFIASSNDGGKTWTAAKRINSGVEAIQGEENGPKLAFDRDGKIFAAWSIPGANGDKTRANIRFTMEDGQGAFTTARTLNEVRDAGRFPIVETTPDGNLLIAWIDRRVDNPKPRQLYLIKIDSRGHALAQNYRAGDGLCDCKLGIEFADDGTTFDSPVEICNDGWQVPS